MVKIVKRIKMENALLWEANIGLVKIEIRGAKIKVLKNEELEEDKFIFMLNNLNINKLFYYDYKKNINSSIFRSPY